MEKYKNVKEFENALQEMDDCPDNVEIGNIVFTMDNYDAEGKEVSFGNKRTTKGFTITTEDRYKNGFRMRQFRRLKKQDAIETIWLIQIKMTIIKNGCSECNGDWHTTTEQCDTPDCKGEKKSSMELGADKCKRCNKDFIGSHTLPVCDGCVKEINNKII